jgi:peptidoglycan/xylan/chitin deacetylase (PgdA/CDA1 family)
VASRVGAAAALAAAGSLGAVLGAHCGPMMSAFAPVRARLHPTMSGIGNADHVALTFDESTDPEGTPCLADALTAEGVRATFFLRGDRLARHRWLGRLLSGGGHEVALHGWTHVPMAPGAAARQALARAATLVEEVTGTAPRWYRPAYGLLTGPAMRACRVVGLTPVLWSVRGLDRLDPDRLLRSLAAQLRGGATLALRPRGGWRPYLLALPGLLALCAERGLRVGPLAEHGLPGGDLDEDPGHLVVRIVHNGTTRSRAVAGVDGPAA